MVVLLPWMARLPTTVKLPPMNTFLAIPAPPLTTRAPLPVPEESVLFVRVVTPLAVSVVNAPELAVLAPMAPVR